MAARKARGEEVPPKPEARNWTRGLDDVVAYQLRRAQEASFAAYSRSIDDLKIWPGWYALLRIIHDNPGINQTELSAATGRDKSTLTASLRELGKAGLVLRERDEMDRRNFRLSLSDEGRGQLQKLEAKAQLHNQKIDSLIGESHRETFLMLLKRVTEGLL